MSLRDIISEIQTTVATLTGVRDAPTDPRDTANVFPLAFCYPDNGESNARPLDDRLDLHNIRLDLMVSRKNLSRDLDDLYDYPELVANALFSDVGDGPSNYNTINRISYSTRPAVWGGINVLQFSFLLEGVKARQPITDPNPPTQIIYDTFTGSGSLDAHAPDVNTPGNPWVELSGDWNVSGGTAQTTGNGQFNAVIDSGLSDCVVTDVIILGPIAGNTKGLIVRATSDSNLWLVGLSSNFNQFLITEVVAGVFVNRATTTVSVSPSSTNTIAATLNGNTITATLNGGSSISYASATFNNTATKHGIRVRFSAEKHDSFEVVAL